MIRQTSTREEEERGREEQEGRRSRDE